MKLLIITSVAEFGKDVKQILKQAQVRTYSYNNVIGYRNAMQDALATNWFGTEMNENESVLFYAFVPTENVTSVCEAVNVFNSKQETLSHIHVAVLNIEKFN